MALVAYDYDSNEDSEIEEDDEETATSCVVIKDKIRKNLVSVEPATASNDVIDDENIEEEVSTSSLFSSLPDTKTMSKVEDEDDVIEDFIPKSKPVVLKQKEKVKITIPSLSQFDALDDGNEPLAKKLKPAAKGSGLLSMLPPVRGTPMTTKSFIPNIVASKHKTTATSQKSANSLVPNVLRKKAEAKKFAMMKKVATKNAGSDLESDDDFDMPETFDDEMWEKVCGRPKPKKIVQEPEEVSTPMEVVNIAPEPETPYDGLDNAAFKELVGKSKRPIGKIKLIDINEEEILQEKDLWMAKSLTDPDCAPKPVVEDPVDPTRRKRHHITYLAQQAKANEQELQNQWSSSKSNRMQTRAKYGF